MEPDYLIHMSYENYSELTEDEKNTIHTFKFVPNEYMDSGIGMSKNDPIIFQGEPITFKIKELENE